MNKTYQSITDPGCERGGSTLLQVDDLMISFTTLRGQLKVVENVSFSLQRGEIVGLVGESGSGKSVTALALMRLLGQEGRIDRGTINLDGQDIM